MRIGRQARTTRSRTASFVNDREAEVVFLPRRGLYVADPLGRFTWLTAGVFIEICSIAAHSLGFELEVTFDYSPMYSGRRCRDTANDPQACAWCRPARRSATSMPN